MNRDLVHSYLDQIIIWVLVVLTFIYYLFAPDTIAMTSLAIIMFISVPGYLIVHLISRFRKLPAIEGLLLTITLSAVIGLCVFLLDELVIKTGDFSVIGLILASISAGLSLIVIAGRTSIIEEIDYPVIGTVAQFKKDLKTKGNKEKIVLLVSLTIIVAVVVVSLSMALNTERERFSEFYILSETGGAYNIPSNYTMGNSTTIKIGVVNHEGKEIKYFVEVWLVNYTNINNAVTVSQMYYYDSFNVTLENIDVDLNDEWSPQFETNYQLNFTVAGNYTLFFMLFPEQEEELPEPLPLDQNTNYATTSASWRIVECVNDQIQFLRMDVTIYP